MPAAPAAAAAAVHQPKIVQTAFIHKLYSMLEDPSIQHLISWSASAESFVMSPSADFSKVLADNKNLSVRDSSGPPTRRGSMAHILNPTDTAERDDEDEDPRGDDDRKRKRMQ
ncbi:hypothetical protein COL26b_003579 [Colletotrichum chrysophilum]|uniref:uncharacterized protein n=1 Tax=Colletotrichum chrysophilum TaxID=1836956 RepID=UPI002301F0CF|nr:uncharacterized protein COL26b_003579 [Colletotrichum chrysophilum]KAJ0342460.1 hypothetical protein COL922a_001151 [Colletotrichum nupharicola]KAJ0378153.1 hypothetical protein COL26b_003579 [Colletotrichum chrysophilum]